MKYPFFVFIAFGMLLVGFPAFAKRPFNLIKDATKTVVEWNIHYQGEPLSTGKPEMFTKALKEGMAVDAGKVKCNLELRQFPSLSDHVTVELEQLNIKCTRKSVIISTSVTCKFNPIEEQKGFLEFYDEKDRSGYVVLMPSCKKKSI